MAAQMSMQELQERDQMLSAQNEMLKVELSLRNCLYCLYLVW